MAVTTADITALGPELADLDEADIEVYLDLASIFVDPNLFKDNTDRAIKFLTAHYLVSGTNTGGSLLSEKVGDVERTYSASNQSDGELATTKYGRIFLALRKTTARFSPIMT